MPRRYPSYIVLFAAFVVITTACRKPHFQPTWETKWLAPLVNTDLTLTQLLGDTIVKPNGDGSLQLVYHHTVYAFDPNANAIRIPDTTVKTTYKIAALKLANDTVVYPYSLGRFCSQLGLAGQIIALNNLNSMVINAIAVNGGGNQPIDATAFFQTATLQTGFINITLQNNFPIPLDSLVFQISNQVLGNVLATDTFINVPPGGSQTKVIDLSGKYVEGHLNAKIVRLVSSGSNGNAVLIDTSKTLTLTMIAHDMVVQSATAVFPSQNLIDENQETVYHLSGGAKLDALRVKSGKLKLVIHSTLPQTAYFTYSLPSASSPTSPNIVLNETLPPSSAGQSSSVTEYIDLAGYTINLQGISGTAFNTFVNHLVVRIDSTGLPITLSASDSVYIDYGLTDIIPDYVHGYLGQQIITVGPDTTALPIFKSIKSGTVGIEDLDIAFDVENSLGAEGRVNIYNLKSIRSQTNTVVPLTAPSLIGQPLFIPRATDNPLTPSHTTIPLTIANSNIKTWLENLPDRVAYQLDVFMNPNGNTANYHDFAYSDTRINLNMDMQMPLSLIATNLTLADTVAFGDISTGASGLQDLQLRLITDNGFPLSANVTIALLDVDNVPLGSLTDVPLQINAAVTGSDCKVQQAVTTINPIPVSHDRLNMVRSARHAVITAVFNTQPQNGCVGYLKIYDTYKLHCKLTGSVTYDITP